MTESERVERNNLLHVLGYMTRDEVYLVMKAEERFDKVWEIMNSCKFPCYRVLDDAFTSTNGDYLYSIKDIKAWIASLPEYPKRRRDQMI